MKPSKNFYQWDINQKFTECDGRFVDFIINEKVVYRVDIVNGECIIPDEFLQKSGYHTVYECMSDYTIQNHMFPVHPREKPPGYVYTPTEKLTFEGLVQKVNDTVADIIHRADTGEFDGYTPVKGEDYFTEAEKNEMVQSVSSGAVGEFREVVNSATSDFNKNSSAKTNEYNTNAEKKLSTYNSNDAEKLKAYNDNHTEKMTAYDTNATDKLSTYNRNAAEKLESYNQNHTAKVAEYNQNAETKTAEFDATAAALQTEVDRLRGECDQLAAENRKQENRISALTKLNKGQTYDILPEEGETASRTAPSGAKYVSVDKVGGKSLVWSQLVDGRYLPKTQTINGITFTNNGDGSITVDGTATENANLNLQRVDNTTSIGHKYLMLGGAAGGSISTYFFRYDSNGGTQAYDYGNGAIFTKSAESITYITIRVISGVTVSDLTFKPQLVDLTQLFGSGNEPATVEEFEAMFPNEYYPYCKPTIISSQTDRVDVASADGTTSKQITTGFPELKSAGSVYDYIDLNEGKLYRRVGAVDMGTFNWDNFVYGESTAFRSYDYTGKKPPGSTHKANIMCVEYETVSAAEIYDSNKDKCIAVHNGRVGLLITDSSYTDVESFKQAMQGVMLYYELAEPVIDDITIPTELTDWLDVEAGGSVTFHDADESKQLPVPNAVSWVRKLNEVE